MLKLHLFRIVYDEVVKQCRKVGEFKVTGSELIGLIPCKSSARCWKIFFRLKRNSQTMYSDNELIDEAVDFLGLDHLEKFDPHS